MQPPVHDEAIVLGLVLALFLSPWLAAGMVLLTAIHLWRRGEIASLFATVPAALALPAFCLLSLTVSLASGNLPGILTAIGMALASLAVLFVRTRMTRALFGRIIDTACAASLYGFAVIAGQRLGGPDSPEFRAASVFLNANYYAAITEIVVLLCLHRLLDAGQPKRWRFAACAMLNLGGLFLSGSRSGALALAAACAVLLLANRRFAILAALGIGCAAFALAAAQVPDLLPRSRQVSPDLVNRIAIWRTAALGFLRHPLFGLGSQAYRLVYGQFGGPPTAHAHNLLLDPLLNYGIAGVTLAGRYFSENLKAIRRLGWAASGRATRNLLAAVLAAIAVHGLTDVAVGSLQTALLVLILLGAAGLAEQDEAAVLARSHGQGGWMPAGWRPDLPFARPQPWPQHQPAIADPSEARPRRQAGPFSR